MFSRNIQVVENISAPGLVGGGAFGYNFSSSGSFSVFRSVFMANALEDLIQKALSVDVLSQEQIAGIQSEIGSRSTDVDLFLNTALRRGWLTNYQVDRLKSPDTFGFLFGNYKALYMIGAGTFARVFRAEHRQTGQVAAVKVLRARFSDNKTFIEHFMTEAKLVSELKHPNIVPVYEAASKGFLHFMAMEFVEGQTLREFLRIRKKVDAKTVLQIAVDVCSGLEYAMRKKIPHRDLKLSNIMLSSTGQAKIVDFGLASIVQSGAGADIPFLKNQQSIDYIALEKAASTKRMDERSDLYFLGCIIYHLLCGESPFLETKDRTKRMDRSRFFGVKPILHVDSSIPHSVAFLVNKAMTVNADQRYQTPGEMLIDLRGTLQRLEAGRADETAATLRFDGLQALQRDKAERARQIETPTVMIVDSNPKMRQGLVNLMVKSGYKTLAVADPDQALAKLLDDDWAAQCVVFNGQSLGMRAVRGFNDFAQKRNIKEIPTLLILDQGQSDWAKDVKEQPHRPVLTMPVTVRQLRETVVGLLKTEETPPDETPPETPNALSALEAELEAEAESDDNITEPDITEPDA